MKIFPTSNHTNFEALGYHVNHNNLTCLLPNCLGDIAAFREGWTQKSSNDDILSVSNSIRDYFSINYVNLEMIQTFSNSKLFKFYETLAEVKSGFSFEAGDNFSFHIYMALCL